jgi:hypothetical protein
MSQDTKDKKRTIRPLNQRLKDAANLLAAPKLFRPILDKNIYGNNSFEDLDVPKVHITITPDPNYDTGAKKNDSGKLPIDLIPVRPLLDLAAVLQHGQIKYDANNWRNGFLFSRTYAAAQRHLLAWHSGEDNDSDSGLSHLMHAACNLFFLSEFMTTHKELDDRVKQND